VLQQPDIHIPEGLRDRAIIETFYATGMRRMEVASLKLYDIDHERGSLMIRQGKGKKHRHIPIGDRALAWIGKYTRDVRAGLLIGPDDGTVFLTDLGEPYTRVQLTALVSALMSVSRRSARRAAAISSATRWRR
jgi:integrase/recombinase XerD